MAAPTLIASSIKTAAASSITSDSLTVQAGDVITILAMDEGNSTEQFGTPTTTLTANGTGIVQLQNHAASSNCAGGGWTFTVGTGGTGTVSLTWSTLPAARNVVLAVFVDRGGVAATATRSALSTSSSRTVAYTASQAHSAIHWILGDWAAATAQTPTPTSTSHTTTTPGPAALPESATVSGLYTQNVATLDDQASTSSVGYGIGGTGTGPFTIIAVEVQGTGGTTPSPFIPRPVRRAPIFRASTF